MTLAVSGSLLVGSNLTLFCRVSSQPLALLEWLFDGESLNRTGQAKLELIRVEERHSGLYSCRAFNNKTLKWKSVTKHLVISGRCLGYFFFFFYKYVNCKMCMCIMYVPVYIFGCCLIHLNAVGNQGNIICNGHCVVWAAVLALLKLFALPECGSKN